MLVHTNVCSLKEGFIVLGILLGYLTGYLFVEDIGGWRSMYGVAAVPALLAGLGMVSLWASPTRSQDSQRCPLPV